MGKFEMEPPCNRLHVAWGRRPSSTRVAREGRVSSNAVQSGRLDPVRALCQTALMRLRSTALVSGTLATVFFLAGCTPGDTPLQHGVIKIDPRPLEGQGSAVFNGTTEVLLSMLYEPCLRDFYQQQPSWSQDGIDGHSVFGPREDGGEGWFDRLCDDPEQGQADCEVISINQFLDMGQQLQVRLRVENPNLEQVFLKFGPIPLRELAGCAPEMHVGTNPAQGFSSSGRIWTTQTWNDSRAAPNQGGRIRVRVERVD
jgi:hypothetical protein